ncbi:DUF211 domain-containing protein [Halobacteria archaeon AArc-m2/3/4]|uniref:DUF211 domain-containing protein n=1 Tax=Natronoglomus mannanivorans TaxID=2979990 RepID=A0AAP2Z312_9EURY|nr:DUF211 domain-containing protein [Halobacteria archaeon AArc-xg1-1]MCU4972231.1 DUF211 domain-containing protein [Halobacteria archaeon AArc-m2/3/4]
MAPIRRLVLDVLKPHDPGVVTFATQVNEVERVDAVTSTVVEVDENVKTIRVTIEGTDLDFEAIRTEIEDLSASIHSIDQVATGDRIAEDPLVGS